MKTPRRVAEGQQFWIRSREQVLPKTNQAFERNFSRNKTTN